MLASHPAPRLNVLLASEAPVGVVFRRGPSKFVQLFMWNRERDKFKPGSSFRGRLYPDRSDISPDGRHLIYFAMGGIAWAIPATLGNWTAISKLPSLKAIALWGQGDTWAGGGKFLSNKSYWLDINANTFLIRDHSGLRRVMHARHHIPGIIEKPLPKGWVLRKPRFDAAYELEQPGECTLSFPDWEWAGWDRHRLVWTEHGYLRAAELHSHTLGTIHTLHDFNHS